MLIGRLTSILYKPAAADATFVGVALILILLSALCATLLPAGRPARMSPIDAIRTEI
jgi:ABC-type lipoprotein release transport system permease subunit